MLRDHSSEKLNYSMMNKLFNILVSSTCMTNFLLLVGLIISFIYKRNKIGAPKFTGSSVDSSLPEDT